MIFVEQNPVIPNNRIAVLLLYYTLYECIYCIYYITYIVHMFQKYIEE